MKKLSIIISIFFLNELIYCQVSEPPSPPPPVAIEEENELAIEEEPDNSKVFSFVQQQPEFVGGPAALLKYIDANLIYPDIAKKNAIEGKVVVKFVVRKDSTITDIKVLRGLQGGCSEEAVRIISNMPKWKPGKNNGKEVDCYFSIPISFKLKE